RKYGTRVTYIDVSQANPLVDPNRLKVGQVIKLPPKPAPAAADATPRNNTPTVSNNGRPIHTVQASETLSSISGQYYNDPNQWHVIYEANRQVIGANPDRLREGMKLVIPPAPN